VSEQGFKGMFRRTFVYEVSSRMSRGTLLVLLVRSYGRHGRSGFIKQLAQGLLQMWRQFVFCQRLRTDRPPLQLLRPSSESLPLLSQGRQTCMARNVHLQRGLLQSGVDLRCL